MRGKPFHNSDFYEVQFATLSIGQKLCLSSFRLNILKVKNQIAVFIDALMQISFQLFNWKSFASQSTQTILI